MKNLIILIVAITLSLSSCKKEESPAPWVCSPCGTYDIIVDGVFHTPLFSSPIDSVPTILIVEALDSNSIQVSFDLAPILGSPDTNFLTVEDCTFIGSNLDGESSFLYDSIATIDILLASILSNSGQNIEGIINLSNDAIADFEFRGEKQ